MVSECEDGVQAGSDPTWSATQVGVRGVKVGLGGQDDSVSGDDQGVENTSLSISKRGWMAWFD